MDGGLFAGGGVSGNQENIADPNIKIYPPEGMSIQVGKRRVVKLECPS